MFIVKLTDKTFKTVKYVAELGSVRNADNATRYARADAEYMANYYNTCDDKFAAVIEEVK